MASAKFHTRLNYLIIILIGVYVILTILAGINDTLNLFGMTIQTPDYIDYYVPDWNALLTGQNPYNYFYDGFWRPSFYPMGFLIFSLGYALNPVVPKVIFVIIMGYTVYYINGLCKKYEASRGSTFYSCFALILINPIYVGSLVISGHNDVVIGLCILLAVICVEKKEQIKSGLLGAFAFLIKYVGILILFPLTFMKKRVNWRIGVTALSLCGVLYLIGYFLWGTHIFAPFIAQLGEGPFARVPQEGSVYLVIEEIFGFDLFAFLPYMLIVGAIVVSIVLYFINTDVVSFSLISILGFLLISPVYYVHYGAWIIPLAIYWSLKRHGKLQELVVLYFGGLLLGALVSWFSSMWIGALIIFITTALYALMIFFNRTKEPTPQNSNHNELVGQSSNDL